MRILFFAPRKCWPLNSGARLRDYHLARQLACGASVTYLALCYPEQEEFAGDDVGLPVPETIFERVLILPEARSYRPVNVLRGFFGSTPVTVLNWTSRAAAEQISKLGRETRFDAIHLVGVHLVQYLPVLRSFQGDPPVLCDWHDIQSEKMRRYSETIASFPRRIYARRTAGLLENMEKVLLDSCDAHTVVSARDRSQLESIAPGARVSIVENGVDAAYFGKCDAPVTNKIVFVGAMDYHPNEDAVTWFASEMWPGIRRRFPDMRFLIVGRKPTAAVSALAAQPGIEVLGTVPDVRPYYAGALAVVVPLRWGSGTRLKILEAMAAGVPVVSTTLGAEGLETRHGEEILIADSAAEMQKAIVAVHEDAGLRERLISRGRERVRCTYDWGIPGSRLLAMYESGLKESNS